MRQDGQAENISKFNPPSLFMRVHTLINGPKQVKVHVHVRPIYRSYLFIHSI